MTRKDLKEIDNRMLRIIKLTEDMAGERDIIKVMDLRLEITKLAGGTRGIIEYYLTLED